MSDYNELANPTGYPGGVTMRDYFAAKAMQAFLSHAYESKDREGFRGWGELCIDGLNAHKVGTAHSIAQFAYAVADAMIETRKGGAA